YVANADDPNEVSIAKDEVMLVIDDSGKWWQVKKDDGVVGIAPSNYLTRILS
ncbi:Transmembrane osmosensor, partial [Coemansia sp. RSA 2611]